MELDSLKGKKKCLVPFSFDLLHPRFQDSEEVFSWPPHRRLSLILASRQRVKPGPVLHLFEIVFHGFLISGAFVICIDECKSRPRPVIYARYEHGYLYLVYTIVQVRRFGKERCELQKLQVTCSSQWFLVGLDTIIFDKSWALLVRVERKVKF